MNKVILIGNVGKDATVKNVNDKYLIGFNIATTEKYQKNGETKQNTEWHSCSYWVKSDKLAQYITKGTKLAIEGKLKHDSYEKEGNKSYYTYVLVSNIEFLSSKKNDSNELPY